MTHRSAAWSAALTFALAFAPSARAALPAPALTAAALRASMLGADSLLIARVELDVPATADPAGANPSSWRTEVVSAARGDRAWLRRFTDAFLPPAAVTRAEGCPPPSELSSAAKPWKLAVTWFSRDGGGRAYLDFRLGCAMVTAGKDGATVEFRPAVDTLFAMFREALPGDTLLRRMTAAPAPPPAPTPIALAPAHMPELVHKVLPAYPEAARQKHIQGMVTLDVTVDTEGRIASAKVKKGVPGLNEAALAAVRQWTFKPARDGNGNAVSASFLVPLNFQLTFDTPAPAKKPVRRR